MLLEHHPFWYLAKKQVGMLMLGLELFGRPAIKLFIVGLMASGIVEGVAYTIRFIMDAVVPEFIGLFEYAAEFTPYADRMGDLLVWLSVLGGYIAFAEYWFPIGYGVWCIIGWLSFQMAWWVVRRFTGMIPFVRG